MNERLLRTQFNQMETLLGGRLGGIAVGDPL